MRKHPIDLTSLLAGLVFVALALVYLGAAATGNHVDASWVLPIALVALGLAGVVGGVSRAVRGPTADEYSPAAATAPTEPTVVTEPTDASEPDDDTGAGRDEGSAPTDEVAATDESAASPRKDDST